ncbi:hypothetical protein OMO38_07465 [Chryseobacterium sp. 09-1422]|uniref:Lipoprotein n=1 Tax=Chryseobacterium kimseyorum TaxID=2984028 RepID=A0ABT3HX41_9FLAO|nr:hypothetical protein [Chryseobacterium kimseyorum]MCW3168362.1 hypothetical protein [Chryseobacterium kimseyorum]
MNKIIVGIVSLIFMIGCSKSNEQEKIELNKMLNTVLKYESERYGFSKNHKFLINGELRKLKIYIPGRKEILGEEPGPPSSLNKNIIRLLDLNENEFKSRKSDSLNLLKQNAYIFDSLYIDPKINLNIAVADKEEVYRRKKLYQFSNPVYFNENIAYIETSYYESVFGIGFGYLLEKQKNGDWKIKKIINTFIT